MSYYKTCPFCGCRLDPDEKCDCIDVGLPECSTIRPMTEGKKKNAPRCGNTGKHSKTVKGKEVNNPFCW